MALSGPRLRTMALLMLAAGVASNVQRRQPALMTELHRGLPQLKAPSPDAPHAALGASEQPVELETISESRSYNDRVKDSGKAFICGCILFLSSFVFLYFVEMETSRAFVLINRARKAVQTGITLDKVQKKYQNCMVHVSGHATVDHSGQLDDELGVTPAEKCLVLKRTVEVYQWVEIKERKEKRTDYQYTKYWREDDVDSGHFRYHMGHANPPRQHKFYSKKFMNERVQLGAFELKPNVLEKMDQFIPLDNLSTTHSAFSVADQLGDEAGKCGNREIGFEYILKAAAEPDSMSQKLTGRTYSISGLGQHLITGDKNEMGLYTTPQVGDMRISYQVIKEGPVSICGVQTENTFRRFLMKRDGIAGGHDPSNMYETIADEEPPPEPAGCGCADMILRYVGAAFPHSVLLVNAGIVDKEMMFSKETWKLAKTKWIMRFIGFSLMWSGLFLILSPIADVLSFIPFVSKFLKSLFWIKIFVLT